METKITVRFSTIDRYRETRYFRTLLGAAKYAQKMLGKTPEMGSTYAVSGDGAAKITVEGCSLLDLFPDLQEEHRQVQEEEERYTNEKKVEMLYLYESLREQGR